MTGKFYKDMAKIAKKIKEKEIRNDNKSEKRAEKSRKENL